VLVGRLLKLIGDVIAIATMLFVVSMLIVGWLDVSWPEELAFMEVARTALVGWLGPGWWALTAGVGAVLGVALNRKGRELLRKERERHRHYR
jgi:hypothetical protein